MKLHTRRVTHKCTTSGNIKVQETVGLPKVVSLDVNKAGTGSGTVSLKFATPRGGPTPPELVGGGLFCLQGKVIRVWAYSGLA